MRKRKTSKIVTTIRLTAEDRAAFEVMKRATGLETIASVIRLSLREAISSRALKLP